MKKGDRPGVIRELFRWQTVCNLCGWRDENETYQETSIALTLHLTQKHPDWDMEGAK